MYHKSKKSQSLQKIITTSAVVMMMMIIIIITATTTAAGVAATSGVGINHNREEDNLFTHRHPSLNRDCSSGIHPLNTSTCFSTLRRLLLAGITQSSSFLSHLLLRPNTQPHTPNSPHPDCLEMMHQTAFELDQAILLLNSPLDSRKSRISLKALLSAAITNGHTCTSSSSPYTLTTSAAVASLSGLIRDCLWAISYAEGFQRGGGEEREQRELLPWMTDGEEQALIEGGSSRMGADAVVAKDGSGNCTSIGEAVGMVPDWNKKRFLIWIKAGVYRENVVVGREKSNVVMVGEGFQNTVIVGNRSFVDGFSTFNSATLAVGGDRFVGRGIGVENRAGPGKHQAVAARVTANAAFYWCRFTSYQDTLYVHSLRQIYKDCTIEGTVDFIFGNAEAVFKRCTILVRRPLPGQTNIITAQGRGTPYEDTGIWLRDCSIKAAAGFDPGRGHGVATFMGRPWRNYSRTVVERSYIGEVVHPEGWCRWDRYSDVGSVEYVECMNYGPGSDLRGRVTWPGYSSDCPSWGEKQLYQRTSSFSSLLPFSRGGAGLLEQETM